MKYVSTDIVMKEIPNEVSLSVFISGCPNHCEGCHSKFLWEDKGHILCESSIEREIRNSLSIITCVVLMGGDQDPFRVLELANYIKCKFPELKVAWYSGRNVLPSHCCDLDFVKLGPYMPQFGPLDSPTTNQRFYERGVHGWVDKTYLFHGGKSL